MKSLRQFRNDLLDIRLQATNVSVWVIQSALTAKANRAINDALASYEMHLRGLYSSVVLTGKPQIVPMPRNVGYVYAIEAVDTSNGNRRSLRRYHQVATAQTNILYLNEMVSLAPDSNLLNPAVEQVDLFFETEHSDLPADTALVTPITPISISSLAYSGGGTGVWWQYPAYVELSSPVTTTDVREVVYYTGVTQSIALDWTAGTIISAVFPGPERILPVVAAKAQAVMYEYWIRNRALYEQYTALVSQQALEVPDLLGLSRSFEDKADRMYFRITPITGPPIRPVSMTVGLGGSK